MVLAIVQDFAQIMLTVKLEEKVILKSKSNEAEDLNETCGIKKPKRHTHLRN